MSVFGKLKAGYRATRTVFEDAQYLRGSKDIPEMRRRLEKIKAREF